MKCLTLFPLFSSPCLAFAVSLFPASYCRSVTMAETQPSPAPSWPLTALLPLVPCSHCAPCIPGLCLLTCSPRSTCLSLILAHDYNAWWLKNVIIQLLHWNDIPWLRLCFSIKFKVLIIFKIFSNTFQCKLAMWHVKIIEFQCINLIHSSYFALRLILNNFIIVYKANNIIVIIYYMQLCIYIIYNYVDT